jgi:hypothetical protein
MSESGHDKCKDCAKAGTILCPYENDGKGHCPKKEKLEEGV